jgi:preprotein translocase subunit YajC
MIPQAPAIWIAQTSGTSMFLQFVPLILIFVIFWFLVIAPMRRQQKRRQEVIDNLKRGDKVITNGGLFGEVVAIEGAAVHLKVADATKIKVSRSAIAGLQGEADGGDS